MRPPAGPPTPRQDPPADTVSQYPSAMPSVPGYTHTPGHHCGSTALRNLLGFHGAEISEEMAFGLGAGACFYYVTLEDASPSRWFNGRTARLEENFGELTGAALELRTFEEGDDGAWEAARAEVDAGHPVLLLTDLYYLDHYGNSAHFPGHAVVLAGYDEEFAHLSDTGFEELQTTTRLEDLDRARHSSHPAYPLAGHMFTASGAVTPGAAARGDPGGDRARRQGDGRARVPRVLRPRRRRAPRRGGRQLARGRRGLAVVRPLRLPGDRAPRHRRRRLPPHVLALPRGGGPARGAARRRGGGPLDRRSPAPSTPPARATIPTRPSGARSTRRPSRSPRPRTASGPPWPESWPRATRSCERRGGSRQALERGAGGGRRPEPARPRGRGRAARRQDPRAGRAPAASTCCCDFGDLVLHSHLGMSGSWHVYERGATWRKPPASGLGRA